MLKNFGFPVLLFIAIAEFLILSIWLGAFVKNTGGSSDLVSDVIFGFSYLDFSFSSIGAAIMHSHLARNGIHIYCD